MFTMNVSAPGMAMPDLEAFTCKHCRGPFDENTNPPLLLFCNHTSCRNCLLPRYQSIGVVECPFCHVITPGKLENVRMDPKVAEAAAKAAGQMMGSAGMTAMGMGMGMSMPGMHVSTGMTGPAVSVSVGMPGPMPGPIHHHQPMPGPMPGPIHQPMPGPMPGPMPTPVQRQKYSVVDFRNGKSYFFCGPVYFRYDNKTDRVDEGYPMTIAEGWKGVWKDGFDTAFCTDTHNAYFFKGTECVHFDLKKDAPVGAPQPIKNFFPNLPFPTIDAAVAMQYGDIYFFKGQMYVKYDRFQNAPEAGYPRPIADGLKGVWADGIDSALCWDRASGYIYMFKGNQYVKYNPIQKKVETGYPMEIEKGWTGIQRLS